MSSRGKTPYAAGELVFGVNNPAVLLRKILGFFLWLRQYVVSSFCRIMDSATIKLDKSYKEHYQNAKGAQHGKYNLCRYGCPQG